MLSCIEVLFEHNFACREPLLEAVKQISKEDFTRDLGVGRNSIRDILVHLVNTEIHWIDHVLRGITTEQIFAKDYADAESIREAWKSVETTTREFLRDQNERGLQHVKSVTWGDVTVSFTVAKALLHLATHETHHRGLMVGLLRQLGYKAPDVNMM
ncbi:MAG: DinB family protein [Candidatus Thorarchaeota archaeon]